MTTESILQRIEQEAQKALIKNAVFRLESAVLVGGTILASVFLPNAIGWIPWWSWPILGVIGEAAVIITSLTDKAEQQKVVESLFREKFSTAGFRDRNLREKLTEAEQYRQRIQAVVDQQRSGVLRDRMKSTTSQVYDWLANMVALARRLDMFRMDPLIRRDLETVPKEIKQLEARLNLEGNPRVREQMATTLESNRRHLATLQELFSRMQRADLQLDNSLAALGTVYSQLLLIGTKDVDSDRTDRLREDIRGEVLALQDLVDSLNEVYSGGPWPKIRRPCWNEPEPTGRGEKMMRKVNVIAQGCKRVLEQHYGPQFRGLVLYGSVARKQATPDSDIDLLVLAGETLRLFARTASDYGHSVPYPT